MLRPRLRATTNERVDLVYPFDYRPGAGTGGGGSGGGGTGGGGEGGGGEGGGGTSITVNPTGPMEIFQGILTLNTRTPIYTDRNVATGKNELSLFIDDDTMALKQANRALLVKTALPVTAGTGSGVTLKYDQGIFGLDSTTGAFTIVLEKDGPLQPNGPGLVFNYNHDHFLMKDGAFSLVMPYTSPFAIMDIIPQNGITETGTGRVMSGFTDQDIRWPVGYSVYMVSSAGIVNGIISLYLPRKSLTAPKDSDSKTTGIRFTFVVSPTYPEQKVGNFSSHVVPVVSPANRKSIFLPDPQLNPVKYVTLPDQVDSTDWYVPATADSFQQVTFRPAASTGTFSDSIMGYGPAVIGASTGEEGPGTPSVMVFSFSLSQTSGDNWYNTTETDDALCIGPLSFSYQGHFYNPEDNASTSR